MKLTTFTNLLAVGLALSFSVTGCKHKPVGVTPLPNAGRTGPGDLGNGNPLLGGPGTGENGASGTGIAAAPAGIHTGWTENATQFEADTVHFAYDSSAVRSDDKSKIAHVADYLKANSAAAVKIEGHCDERGTDEYNRSLGERRALAVREELVGMGIDPTRVETISYGRQRPIDTGASDEAHARNRRGAFVLLTPP